MISKHSTLIAEKMRGSSDKKPSLVTAEVELVNFSDTYAAIHCSCSIANPTKVVLRLVKTLDAILMCKTSSTLLESFATLCEHNTWEEKWLTRRPTRDVKAYLLLTFAWKSQHTSTLVQKKDFTKVGRGGHNFMICYDGLPKSILCGNLRSYTSRTWFFLFFCGRIVRIVRIVQGQGLKGRQLVHHKERNTGRAFKHFPLQEISNFCLRRPSSNGRQIRDHFSAFYSRLFREGRPAEKVPPEWK